MFFIDHFTSFFILLILLWFNVIIIGSGINAGRGDSRAKGDKGNNGDTGRKVVGVIILIIFVIIVIGIDTYFAKVIRDFIHKPHNITPQNDNFENIPHNIEMQNVPQAPNHITYVRLLIYKKIK